MRICLYTATALPKLGGQELVVDALARQFQSLGHEVMVLAPCPRRPLRPDDSQLPYPVVRHPRFRSARFLVSWYRYFLQRAHRRHPFDLLHCHGIDPPGYLAAASRARLGALVAITSHGGDLFEGCSRLGKSAARRRYESALAAADVLVAISPFTAAGYRRVCARPAPIVHLPNGVDLRSFACSAPRPAGLDPRIEADRYLLFLGRVNHRKGLDTLLKALARLPNRQRLGLVIAGDGDQRQDYEALARELGIGQQVCFVGAVFGEAKTWLLQNARACVLPSRFSEAFPLVVLESYAAGAPVIGSSVPGLSNLVAPEETGLLVPPEDPAALAEAMRRLLDEPDTARRWGERCRRIASSYDWPIVAARHLQLYRALLEARDAGRPFQAELLEHAWPGMAPTASSPLKNAS